MKGNHDGNPIFCSGPGDVFLVHPPTFQPLSDEVETLIIRPDEIIDLVLRKILAVPLMVWVAYFHQVLFQDVELRLRKRYSKAKDVVRGSKRIFDPARRWVDRFFDRGHVPFRGCRSRNNRKEGRERNEREDRSEGGDYHGQRCALC